MITRLPTLLKQNGWKKLWVRANGRHPIPTGV